MALFIKKSLNYINTVRNKGLWLAVKKILSDITYIFFFVDLEILHFFSRKYPYVFFIFAFFFGNFGYDSEMTKNIFAIKFAFFVVCYQHEFSSIYRF